MASAAASSLAVTVAHAIDYLTRPLIPSYPAAVIIKLQLALEANLTAQYAPTWIPSEPLRGSGRRCLTLSPATAPPRALHTACVAARVDWSEWIKLLGNVEFDFFVDPGCISVRFGHWSSGKAGKFLTVWSEEISAHTEAVAARSKPAKLTVARPAKTFAQELLEDDSREENELFAMIADEVRDPTWITPILAHFPSVPTYPLLADVNRPSPISRPSSRASTDSSSGSSFFSSPESNDSFSSFASDESQSKMSRRERARRAKVYIDTSKTEVTNYDGGKTTVLTGGVMLGASKKANVVTPPLKDLSAAFDNKKFGHGHNLSSSSGSWRATSRV